MTIIAGSIVTIHSSMIRRRIVGSGWYVIRTLKKNWCSFLSMKMGVMNAISGLHVLETSQKEFGMLSQ